jgi:hypothetical protein
MARNIHRLTDRQIRSAKKPIADGGNLWLYPRGNARSWIFRYSLAGRARAMGSVPIRTYRWWRRVS